MRNFSLFSLEQVEWAAFMRSPPRFGGRKNRQSRAQRAGVAYERKAQDWLEELYPDTYVRSPWIAFRLKGEPMMRYCQPDGVVIDIVESKLTIIEIKLRHMPEAYQQITGIYEPVLRKILPEFRVRRVELVQWYDPHTYFPTRVQMISDISLAAHGAFCVHIWNP